VAREVLNGGGCGLGFDGLDWLRFSLGFEREHADQRSETVREWVAAVDWPSKTDLAKFSSKGR
jgi:hypothetical protein